MKKHTITLISELEPSEVQAWTFNIEESDLIYLMEKYGASGSSVLADADGIAEEIRETWK